MTGHNNSDSPGVGRSASCSCNLQWTFGRDQRGDPMPVALNLQIEFLAWMLVPSRPVGMFRFLRCVHGARRLGLDVLLLALLLLDHRLWRNHTGYGHRRYSRRHHYHKNSIAPVVGVFKVAAIRNSTFDSG